MTDIAQEIVAAIFRRDAGVVETLGKYGIRPVVLDPEADMTPTAAQEIAAIFARDSALYEVIRKHDIRPAVFDMTVADDRSDRRKEIDAAVLTAIKSLESWSEM